MRTMLESYLGLETTQLLGVVLEAQTRASGSAELPVVAGLLDRPGIRRVLDIGTGEGSYLCTLAGRLPHTKFVGCEHNEFSVAAAQQRARRQRRVNVSVQTRFFDARFPPRRWDAIITRYTLQHSSKPREFLAAAFARLRRRGLFVATESVEDYTDCHRDDAVWFRYRDAVQAVHASGHSNGDIGKALGALLAAAGFRDVHVRLAVSAPSTVGYDRFRAVVLSSSALGHSLFPDVFDRKLVRDVQRWLDDRDRVLRSDPYTCTAVADGIRP
jgi:SAM-dependent methyltransferase